MSYDLYYWPMIPGRGEYPRLVLEAAEVRYRDVCRLPEEDGGGIAPMMDFIEGRHGPHAPFAPPFLVADGDILVSQSAECSAWLGERHGLAPAREADRQFARSIALTTADLVDEVHDVHHPLGTNLYYEDQKPEALRRAAGFRDARLPKYLTWYEMLIANNPSSSGFLVGDHMTYADLGLFQTLAGLYHAFPRRMAAIQEEYANIAALVALVTTHHAVAGYLASERRLAFSQDGIFRDYRELDGE